MMRDQFRNRIFDPETLLANLKESSAPNANTDSWYHHNDNELREIEKLLHNESDTNALHKALVLSLNELRKCHQNEKQLSRKVENLENMMLNKSQNTSRFGS